MSTKFELVIYSTEDTSYTESVYEKIDPQRRIFTGVFGKESSIYHKGNYCKDLKFLNRDLKNIVVLDTNNDKLPF